MRNIPATTPKKSTNPTSAVLATLLGAALTTAPAVAHADADAAGGPILSPMHEGKVPSITVHGNKGNGYYFGANAAVAYAEAEDDDQLTATVYSGRKKLFDFTCRRGGKAGNVHRNFTDRAKDVPVRKFACDHRETVKHTGTLTVRYDYTSAATEKTYKNIGERTVEVALLGDDYHALPEQWVGPVFYVHEWENDSNSNELRTKMSFFTYGTCQRV